MGAAADNLLVEVELVPALWALTQSLNSRVFQHLCAVDIARQVLGDGLKPYDRCVRSILKRQDYAVRDYCVQYHESDYDFVRRLFHEEGVGFYFDHSGHAEEMVLVDANQAYPEHTSPAGKIVRLASPGAGAPNEEVVQALRPGRALRPTSVVLREYDWQKPNMLVRHELRGHDCTQKERVIYDSAPALCLEANGRDGRARLQIHDEQNAIDGWLAKGEGNVSGLMPGCRLELQDHGVAALEGRYLVTTVEHEGTAPGLFAGVEKGESEYHNSFGCIPEEVPYRPVRELKRPVLGTQTATVVGPSGEEVFTDEHGRIKVQFHWDREGQRNERSSCWVRVMQSWAGAGFGTVFLPRVGMEVVVQFLEGNADRPLVVGCVYNGTNPTSMRLPQEKTKSGITTRSSPGGAGYNELIFEDASGQEEIAIHAQKDLQSRVLHDQSANIGHDDTAMIGNNQTIKVGSQQSIDVGADRSLRVGGNEAITIGGNQNVSIAVNRQIAIGAQEQLGVGGNRTKSVGGNEAAAIAANRATQVGANDELTVGSHQTIKVGSIKTESVGGLSLENVGGAKTLSIGAAYAVSVGAAMNTTVGGASTEEVGLFKIVKAGQKLELCCGDSKITLSKSGEVTIEGKKSVKIVGGVIDLN